MARFPLNFAAIEDKAFPVFPPGPYLLRIVEARMENAKSSGELKETISFEIVQGPGPSNEFNGKKILTSYSLQEKAGFRIKKLLGACGIPPERMSDMDDQELVGCTIKATVAVEVYQGKNNNKISNEEPANGTAAGGAPAQSFPAPTGFGAPPAGAPVPAPAPMGQPPAGFGAPPAAQGGWAPQWGQPGANGAPGFTGQAPSPPPAKPAGK